MAKLRLNERSKGRRQHKHVSMLSDPSRSGRLSPHDDCRGGSCYLASHSTLSPDVIVRRRRREDFGSFRDDRYQQGSVGVILRSRITPTLMHQRGLLATLAAALIVSQ